MVNKYLYFFVSFLFSLFFFSCNKYEGGEKVPSYLYIDSVFIKTDPYFEGSASSEIMDVWVYVGGKRVGVFKLPARVPILAKGEKEITFRPGVVMSQVSGYRIEYPFYKSIKRNVKLVPDSIVRIASLQTSYISDIKFAFIEDFESSGILFDTVKWSLAKLERAEYPESSLNSGKFYGFARMTKEKDTFEIISNASYQLPKYSTNVFLELDYCNVGAPIVVGYWSDIAGQRVQQPIVMLNESKGVWKKLYLNLTPYITGDGSGAKQFFIFLAAIKNKEAQEALVQFDNIKLIHYEAN